MTPNLKLLGFNAMYVRNGIYLYAHFEMGAYTYIARYCMN